MIGYDIKTKLIESWAHFIWSNYVNCGSNSYNFGLKSQKRWLHLWYQYKQNRI